MDVSKITICVKWLVMSKDLQHNISNVSPQRENCPSIPTNASDVHMNMSGLYVYNAANSKCFYQAQENVHKVMTSLFSDYTTGRRFWPDLAKKQTLYIFLYWARMIPYAHLLVCNGCVL